METNPIPVVENGMINIRSVKVELLATPSQTWDLNIRGTVYHITQEQEVALLRAVLLHKGYPSHRRIAYLPHSGKKSMPPSPAAMAQMVTVSHTCIDKTNTRKPCSEVFGIRGFGYMSNWQAFCYCAPYTLAIFFWAWLAILMGSIAVWIFKTHPGTPFGINDSVSTNFTIFAVCTVAELCFKSGRKYLHKFFDRKKLWFVICLWIGFVFIAAINKHKLWTDRADDFITGISPLIALLGCGIGIIISAFNCYLLLDSAIKEGDDLGTIDQYP